MGCSSRRNALYLGQLGFNVTAIGTNPSAIDMLKSIIVEDKMNNTSAQVYDINNANLAEGYGFISCTVTLMFIDTARIDAIITDMHKPTLAGGYNLIVCAMSTE
jgi:tellurite methyltransferase